MSANFFVPRDENHQLNDDDLNGYTLVLPCVSVGNVPQLSIDLLINLFLKSEHYSSDNDYNDLELIGYIHSKYVRPFAGPDPFNFDGNLLSTSIQIFASKSKKLILIQQRSPIYREYRDDFYRDLFGWLSKHNFAMIIILSSTFDQYLAPEFLENDDNQKGLTIMYLSNNLEEKMKKFLNEKLKIKPVMKVDRESMKPSVNGKIHLPGSGSARSFIRYSQNLSIPTLCLVMYCSEGDNRYHSKYFANKIIEILSNVDEKIIEENNRKSIKWNEPFSWRMVFGDDAPDEIY